MDDRRSPFLLAAAVRPNPSFKPSPNGGHAGHQAQGLRPICACCPARPTVGVGLTRTLGVTKLILPFLNFITSPGRVKCMLAHASTN